MCEFMLEDEKYFRPKLNETFLSIRLYRYIIFGIFISNMAYAMINVLTGFINLQSKLVYNLVIEYCMATNPEIDMIYLNMC